MPYETPSTVKIVRRSNDNHLINTAQPPARTVDDAVILVLVVGTIRLVGSNANNAFSSVASSLQ
jgi:hypothetical protein